MKILAIDTTADTLSVALCEGRETVATFTGNLKKTHSGTLLPTIEKILLYAGLTPADVDMYACAIGPGSFTGLRIGVSTVKGLAFEKNTPTVGVSSLEALAYNYSDREGSVVCPSLNARRNEVYYAVFKINNGIPERLCEDSSAHASVLEEILSEYEGEILFCGDGVEVLRKAFTKINVREQSRLLLYPSAVSVAYASLVKFNLQGGTSPDLLSPSYLKPCQAERERNERLNSK